MDIELACCEVVKHIAYKNIFNKVIAKLRKKLCLTSDEEKAVEMMVRDAN
jgi:hypothetical protein